MKKQNRLLLLTKLFGNVGKLSDLCRVYFTLVENKMTELDDP